MGIFDTANLEEEFELYLEGRVKEKDFTSIHQARHFFIKDRNNFLDFGLFIIQRLKAEVEKVIDDFFSKYIAYEVIIDLRFIKELKKRLFGK